MMLDHVGIEISHYEKSKAFYQKILAPLGYILIMEVEGYAGFGSNEKESGPIAQFWIHQGTAPAKTLHIAFKSKSRKAVDDFYNAALQAGAKDNGKPGLRKIYHENYYGAFILDPDGHNIEAVCHQLE
jgi:catechol 2,3-dioxygenase-like lactoylglutathione lyase family enzyme